MDNEVIKKSPVVIIKNFIILQAAAAILYALAGSWAHYADIYRSLPFSKVVSFQIAQMFFVFSAEIFLIFFIFFRWHKEYFQIKPHQIIHGRGILYRRKTVIPFEHIADVEFSQGPLGKLIKYGTVELKDSLSGKIVKLADVPNPQEVADLILKLKRASADKKADETITDLGKLLANGENEELEFKSTLRWDLKGQKVNRQLEKSVMKTIAAFLNSNGGRVVIGVDDRKNLVGLEYDYVTLGKPSQDGFETHFSHIFESMIGAEYRPLVKLTWHKLQGKDCCIIKVSPSRKPAYLRFDENEEFYIRAGNGTASLKFSQANSYIDSRFKNSSLV